MFFSVMIFPVFAPSHPEYVGVDSPLKQLKFGVAPHEIICNEGLVLIIKYDGSPACVKAKTAEKLAERGWGGSVPPIVSHGGEIVDYVSLIDNLRIHVIVDPEGQIEQPFFSVTGFLIQVNGQSVQVFEYDSAEDANTDASLVSPDGTSIGTSMPFWIDTPHFYHKEKIIVLYVGSDQTITELLESTLGKQFAGGNSMINSFEECVAAGNPVMESYPRQCRTQDGKHFVEIILGKQECEAAGGLWGIWSNMANAVESCNQATSDAGRECTDSSQCESYCQAKKGSKIGSEDTGLCYEYQEAICMKEIRDGVVDPEWCK